MTGVRVTVAGGPELRMHADCRDALVRRMPALAAQVRTVGTVTGGFRCENNLCPNR